ncbi:pyruvate/2-oxoglutarate dehydrogenase complex dihydrolipoamide dehydrogenase (E3) component [Arthrobacter stackebrandtii]|uniref:Pyruvate/2-oxoglutarate dehydrogenase complex dihydrolipoamide dehydrogenase (E3) component n=1 Tax=Arthrobacter stackebrandtii TaxID=272161 RepID=A0ABS4YZU1_9MICC|nr:hypothetical protein [Arthrobacter stackebrandtii]MBP2414224.1 pyruvate/2-oxoglutarate dehydrogenase complex dihydrolipoamide dehydrogenase (E3) component [Arthrobacter stackebrandtii]
MLNAVDWPGIRDRIFGRIDALEATGRAYREGPECGNVSVFPGHGRFNAPKQLNISLPHGARQVITADRFVVAAGSRPTVPDIAGLGDPSLTSSPPSGWP